MSDYGLELVDLTGRWVGFYRHRWEQLGTYPIVADLCQTGTNITGEMYDQITDRSDYLDEFVELIGKDIAHEARRRLQQVVKRFGNETVRNARLPETSDIKGSIKGSQSPVHQDLPRSDGDHPDCRGEKGWLFQSAESQGSLLRSLGS